MVFQLVSQTGAEDYAKAVMAHVARSAAPKANGAAADKKQPTASPARAAAPTNRFAAPAAAAEEEEEEDAAEGEGEGEVATEEQLSMCWSTHTHTL